MRLKELQNAVWEMKLSTKWQVEAKAEVPTFSAAEEKAGGPDPPLQVAVVRHRWCSYLWRHTQQHQASK